MTDDTAPNAGAPFPSQLGGTGQDSPHPDTRPGAARAAGCLGVHDSGWDAREKGERGRGFVARGGVVWMACGVRAGEEVSEDATGEGGDKIGRTERRQGEEVGEACWGRREPFRVYRCTSFSGCLLLEQSAGLCALAWKASVGGEV